MDDYDDLTREDVEIVRALHEVLTPAEIDEIICALRDGRLFSVGATQPKGEMPDGIDVFAKADKMDAVVVEALNKFIASAELGELVCSFRDDRRPAYIMSATLSDGSVIEAEYDEAAEGWVPRAG